MPPLPHRPRFNLHINHQSTINHRTAPVAPLPFFLADRDIQAIVEAYKDDSGNPKYAIKMIISAHYAGEDMVLKFADGEPWKRVFGPVFMYLNGLPTGSDWNWLWEYAKGQLFTETESWPYSFPASEDFPTSDQRGNISENANDLMLPDRSLVGASSRLDTIFRSRNGRPGHRFNLWLDDREQAGGFKFYCYTTRT
ncbi:uncharacterized protein LOC141587543 [Silene latifolia]|uniref:uncharacterized protein LOC141587543 n=1 Tax=Silene latifolia TaxID=37657 RepID=UPI003D7793A2